MIVSFIGGPKQGEKRAVAHHIRGFIYDAREAGSTVRYHYKRYGDTMMLNWSGAPSEFDRRLCCE